MLVFFLWCALVFSVMSLAVGFFWLIDQFQEIPKDDE